MKHREKFTKTAAILAAGFIGTIVAANYAVTHWQPIEVWPGILAPAGVLFAGLAFTLRDLLQRVTGGPGYPAAAIGIGSLISLFLGDGRVALAGACAFLVSELIDLGVFTTLHRRTFLGAVAASNAAGLVVDSLIFLSIAFGSLAFLPGQIIGKAWMTGLALLVLIPVRRRIPQPV
jgi:uncharacterized PurR-regulated membrane protein YhhQ (DUF165 family)